MQLQCWSQLNPVVFFPNHPVRTCHTAEPSLNLREFDRDLMIY